MSIARRRSKGEGSITQLSNGKFRVRIETDPVNGKRHWLTATTDTKKEAQEKLHLLMVEKQSFQPQKHSIDDLYFFMEDYMSAKEAQGLRDTSLQNMRYQLNDVSEFLKDIPVTDITRKDILNYVTYLRKLKLKDRTICQKMDTVKAYFKWLKDDLEVLSKNPAATVYVKRVGCSKRKLDVLSLTEHKELKETMCKLFETFKTVHNKWNLKYRMYPLYILTYETGLREGEVAALKWECVNFEDNTVTVNSKVVYVNHKGLEEGLPKSDAGIRTIKVSSDTMSVLKELKDAYEKKHLHTEYVFANEKKGGTAYPPSTIATVFKQFLGEDRKLTFHGIRHTNASLMIAGKVSTSVIAERLGHSSIQTTYNVYNHVLQEDIDRDRVLVQA